MLQKFKDLLPWWLKLYGKLGLSFVPPLRKLVEAAGFYRHGFMDTAEYSRDVFSMHSKLLFPQGVPPGLTFLELGPGNGLALSLMAAAYNAEQTYLVDIGDFATDNVNTYKKLADDLRAAGLETVPDISDAGSRSEILQRCNASYLVEGMDSLRAIPENSVDIVISQSVVEHIGRSIFAETMRELYRVLKPGGRASHNVDLKDHLGYALNHLRYSEQRWESDLWSNAGFYTNRFIFSEHIQHFKEAGFEIEYIEAGRWDSLPTPRDVMDPAFKDRPEEDLLVRSYHVILRK